MEPWYRYYRIIKIKLESMISGAAGEYATLIDSGNMRGRNILNQYSKR